MQGYNRIEPKGGTAKTTSCVNLGIGLASAGKKVLLIDTDPQGALSISLGYPEPDEMENTLATLMMNIVNDEEFCLEDVLIHHEEGVDILPSNIELSAIEVSLVNVMSRELILRQLVDNERVMVLENRRGNGQVGQVKVSVQKTKGCKQMQPMKRAANY